MPKLHLEIHMQVDVSPQFLKQFKLDELGRHFNLVGDKHHGNAALAGEIANKCFRNNSLSVYHVLATEILEGGAAR